MTALDRSSLVHAFDRLGEAALAAGARIEIAVYGGAALKLASNFRWSSEDVDIASIGPWPDWLRTAVAEITRELNLSPDWLNDAVDVHLSRLADRAGDHHAFGSFPLGGDDVGLAVYVPTAEYMLALKLKAMPVFDPGERGGRAGRHPQSDARRRHRRRRRCHRAAGALFSA